jgi:hypothetical protein
MSTPDRNDGRRFRVIDGDHHSPTTVRDRELLALDQLTRVARGHASVLPNTPTARILDVVAVELDRLADHLRRSA